MDESSDDISQWAASLTPDGTPGVMAQRLREYLGDQGYEKAVAQSDALSAAYLQRCSLINTLLAVAVFFGSLFGIVGLIAFITFVMHMILG